MLRQARMATGRPRVLVFDRCYHGTVDETMVIMGKTAPRCRAPARSAASTIRSPRRWSWNSTTSPR
ncbi:MAG: hypothetical protein IPG49_09280 [Proteobacteria bacterium]|nr:hypothetical protein [Pseudomonadota bacterium]